MSSAKIATVIVLVRDLIFASKIRSAAEDAGVPIQLVRDPKKLVETTGRTLIVDLNLDGAVDAARTWRERTAGEVIAFVAHTDVETINDAREAGIARVLARSAFFERLAEMFRELY